MRTFGKALLFAVLTGLLAMAGAVPTTAETLGDALRENGWDRVLGTWIDKETGGQGLKIRYAWRLRDTLMEITSWEGEKESVSFMGRNPKTGEVYHFGADSAGGGSIGAWSEEDGHAVLTLQYVSAEGEEGGMRLRFRLEDNNTLVMIVDGQEPKTVSLIRADKPDGGGKGHKKDQGATQRKREGLFTGEGMMVYVDTPIRLFDRNEDLTIQEDELKKGYVSMIEQYGECNARLMPLFDRNGDGAIDEDEGAAVRKLALDIARLLPHDQNGDWKVDEKETDDAWERLSADCERRNEAIMARFDRDGDGSLNDEETASARRAIRERWSKAGK